ncbi:malonyl-ACP O-methyltransferase BioC [Pseudomonas sp. GM_Psu_2]|uniref:malonyl-ACP O-methyltransferase BioC n=1 Tax=unclassified Pseudomonas TaxID=196821 RepID=UPI00226A369C|nr:malonyl-ACP O-methyltransferase BioC [Pseudomonas sp. GM_Psu_2]
MQDAMADVLPDKRQVALSFSRAAAQYDGAALLQRRVADGLFARLHALEERVWLDPQRWLDLGSGTGYCSRALARRHPQAEGLALDLAPGMLSHARAQGAGARHYLTADAERLPLRAESCDLIVSSLALQWCPDLPRVLAEARRILCPGGVLAFSSLVAGTLDELRQSWARVDDQVHVNRFRPQTAYVAAAQASGLQGLTLEVAPERLHFPDLRALTQHLKAIGAHNLNQGRPQGLTGRQRLAAFTQAYESLREPAGLPATYQVIHVLLRKE